MTALQGGVTCPMALGTTSERKLIQSSSVYVCWRDKCCVAAMSIAYPGHSEETVACKKKDSEGKFEFPVTGGYGSTTSIRKYNKLDQYLSQTKP